jgi:subtilisin-like proprotein convertase family protein
MKRFLTLGLMLSCALAKAQTYSTSTPLSIPDGPSVCGVDGITALSNISVPITGTITTASDVTINLSIEHTYIGDIALKIVAPDGSSCFLMNHIGADAGACDGSFSVSDAANTLSFNAAYTTPISSFASPIPTGNYSPTTGTTYASACNLSSFLTGKSIYGTWSLNAVDNNNTYAGSIASWSIVFGASLPLQLIAFTGNTYKGYNTLQWQTGVEESIDYVEVERSADGSLYHKIGSMQAKGSNSTYNFTDNQLNHIDAAYYRLKIIDQDGHYTYSKTIRLAVSVLGDVISVLSPNPTQSSIRLSVGDLTLIGTQARLVNSMGTTMQLIDIRSTHEMIDLTQYPLGIYWITLINGESIRFAKID